MSNKSTRNLKLTFDVHQKVQRAKIRFGDPATIRNFPKGFQKWVSQELFWGRAKGDTRLQAGLHKCPESFFHRIKVNSVKQYIRRAFCGSPNSGYGRNVRSIQSRRIVGEEMWPHPSFDLNQFPGMTKLRTKHWLDLERIPREARHDTARGGGFRETTHQPSGWNNQDFRLKQSPLGPGNLGA